MEIIKKNITLVVGIAIPILMILFIAGSIYLPGLFIKPKYNFLFVSGDGYYSKVQYSIKNKKLVRTENQDPEVNSDEEKLFVYDVLKNESQEISFENAKILTLDSAAESPDDFKVVYGSRSGGFFPFFYSSRTDYNTRFLRGNNVSKKLNLQLNGSSSYGFRFLGWIK